MELQKAVKVMLYKNILTAAACALALGAFAASKVSLDGEWTLDYFLQPDAGAVRALPLKVSFKTVKATVPGNCELDLVNAGILPPMEVGLNVLKLRPYECYQWLYSKTFDAPAVDAARVNELGKSGVNYYTVRPIKRHIYGELRIFSGTGK